MSRDHDELPTAACLPVEALADIETLSENDARRQHVQECARCHALWTEFRSFMSNEPEPSTARTPEAMRHLNAVLEREIGGADDTDAKRTVAGWRRWRLSGVRRLLWVPAAAAIVVALMMLGRSGDPTGGSGVVRGESPQRLRAQALLQPGTSSFPTARVRFDWQSVDGADAYELQVLSTDHQEVWRSSAPDTFRLVALDELYAVDGVVLWRVRALRRGDVQASSVIQALELQP